MENHHDQRVEGDECNVHLEERPNQHMETNIISRLVIIITFVDLL